MNSLVEFHNGFLEVQMKSLVIHVEDVHVLDVLQVVQVVGVPGPVGHLAHVKHLHKGR